MPFINVSLTTPVRIGDITFFSAGLDQATFCPGNITLSAIIIGDLTGHTVMWQEVLTYTYIDVNIALNRIILAGNVAATFYSTREIIEIFNTNNGVGLGTYIVTNAFFNGINTELTVLTPLPPFIGDVGVFQHAGSASSAGTVWITPQNQITVQYTPVGGANARFRVWLDRGTLIQQYDDLDVFLTPGHIVPVNRNGTNPNFNPTFFATCRIPPYTLLPASTYGPCDDGAEQIVTSWILQWSFPSCDSDKVEQYIIQQSTDGGNTWTTLTTATLPGAVPVTYGTLVRIVTVYNEPGLVKPLTYTGPYNGVLDSVFAVSPIIYVIQTFSPTHTELYAHDSYCMDIHGVKAANDPITTFVFTPLTALFIDPTTYPDLEHVFRRAYGARDSVDPITTFVFTPLTALFIDPTTYPDLEHVFRRAYGALSDINPITSFTVSGSVVIGG